MVDSNADVEENNDRAPAERGMAPVNKPRTTKFGKALIWLLAAAVTIVIVFTFDGGVPQPITNTADSRPGDDSTRGYRDPRTNSLNDGSSPADPPVFPQFAPPSFPKIEPKAAPALGAGESTAQKTMTPSERRLTGGISMRKQDIREDSRRTKREDGRATQYGADARAWDQRRLGSTTDRYRVQQTAQPATQRSGQQSSHNEDQIASASADSPDSLGGQLKVTKVVGVSARRLPSQSLMIARGRLFECVLDTAISSVIAGQVRCTVPLDVYGEDGKVVLLDRMTEIVGEYRSNLRSAQTRLGILWVRAKTPQGVIIDLASPASDNLGRGGVDGQIDTHFWERFGAAIMLSVLDDALAAAVANSRNSDVFVFGRTQEAGKDAAQIALENSINIPPTLIKNQGEAVSVFLARDLDFRSVYDFKQLGVKTSDRR